VTTPSNDPDSEPRQRRSTESYGLGQSGYTAGRYAGDPALEREIEARNPSYPRDLDDQLLELGDDERWIGRGGSQWYPAPAIESPQSHEGRDP
jgi:hypothetical protein